MLVRVTMKQPKNTNKGREGFIFKFKELITFDCIHTQPVIAAKLQLRSMKCASLYVNKTSICKFRVPGSSVGIATELRAGGSGIEYRWGRDFPPVQTGPGAHPASCKMCTGSFPEVKCGRGVLLTTRPLLVPRSWKSRAIPLPTLWATPGL